MTDDYTEGVCRYCGISYWRASDATGEMICPDCRDEMDQAADALARLDGDGADAG